MEKPIQIALNILNNQEILGKESLTINEVREMLYDVDKMFNVSIETDIKKDFATKEQRDVFNDIMSRITHTHKSINYPDSIFFMVAGNFYIEHNTKMNIVYLSYTFFNIFKSKFDIYYEETCKILSSLIEKHHLFDIDPTTPITISYLDDDIVQKIFNHQ